MKKLSDRAELLLGIIREKTILDDGVVKLFWNSFNGSYPGSVYGQDFRGSVNGAGDARILKMLEERGLIRAERLPPCSYSATEDGLVEYEKIATRRGLYDDQSNQAKETIRNLQRKTRA